LSEAEFYGRLKFVDALHLLKGLYGDVGQRELLGLAECLNVLDSRIRQMVFLFEVVEALERLVFLPTIRSVLPTRTRTWRRSRWNPSDPGLGGGACD